MAAPIRFLSGRQQQQKIGIEGSTEDKKVLEVVGRTGIGTTSFEPAKILDVRGDAIVEGTTTVGKLEITGTGDVPASLTVETANVTGVSTFGDAVDVNAGLDVDGQADLDEVVVAGVATFSSAVDINSTLDVDGDTQLDDLTVAGVATFSSAINATDIIKGYEYTAAPFGSTVTLAVTVASKDSTHRYNGTGSGNAYVIDGIQAPFLTLTPGRTYRFTNDNTGSHPLKFYLEADKTTLYETNVDFQDTYTEITVTDETPTVLHYQCTAHQYMGNAVQTNANVVNTNYPATIRSTLDVTGVSTFPQLDVSTGGLDVDGLTNLDEVVVTGVSTFTGNIVAATAEFSGNVTIGGTLTVEDKTNVDSIGLITARTGVRVTAGGIDVTAGVSTFNGSVDINNSVGVVGGLTADSLTISGVTTGINAAGISSFVRIDVDGQADLDEVVVAGAATFSGSVNFDVNSEVNIGTGVTILGNNLHVTGIVSATEFIGDGSGITNLPGISTLGSSNLTDVNVSGTTTTAQLRVSGIGTAEKFFVSTGGLEVDGQTDLDELVVAGVSTFNANTNVVGDLSVTGDIGASGIITATGINLVAGSGLDVGAIGVLTALSVDVNTGGIDVDGQATLDEVVVAGVSTFSALVDVNNRLDVVGGANIDQVNVTGIASFKQLDVSTGGLDVDGQTDLDELQVAGVSTFSAKAVFNTAYPSIDADNEIQVGTAIQLGKAGVITATSFSGSGASLTAVDAATLDGVDSTSFLRSDAADVKTSGNLRFNDSVSATFGDSDDLDIQHNGVHSYISNYTGSLILDQHVDNGSISLRSDNGSGGVIEYIECVGSSGEVRLRYYGSEKFVTNTGGITVTGGVNASGVVTASSFSGDGSALTGIAATDHVSTFDLVVAGISTFNNDVNFIGNSANIVFDKSQDRLEFADTAAAVFGSGDDLQIYHNSHSYIDHTGANNLHIRNTVDDQDVTIQTDDGSGNLATYFQAEGASGRASMHFYGARKIYTNTGGVDVTGGVNATGVVTATSFSGDGSALTGIAATDHVSTFDLVVAGISTFNNHVNLGDNDELRFGDDNDAKIEVDGSANFIIQGDSTTYLRGSSINISANGGSGGYGSALKVVKPGGGTEHVELYDDGNLRLESTAEGIDVTGRTETDLLNVSGLSTFNDTVAISHAASTFSPHLELIAENSFGGYIIAKHASSYPDLVFASEAGGGNTPLFKGVPSETVGSQTRAGISLQDNRSIIFGTGNDAYIGYDPTPGVLEISTVVSEPITFNTDETERVRIAADGLVSVSGIVSATGINVVAGAGLTAGNTGVITAVAFHGDGSALTGVGTQGPDGSFRGLVVAGVSTFNDAVTITKSTNALNVNVLTTNAAINIQRNGVTKGQLTPESGEFRIKTSGTEDLALQVNSSGGSSGEISLKSVSRTLLKATHNGGVAVSGILTATAINVVAGSGYDAGNTGVITAVAFHGDGSALTGVGTAHVSTFDLVVAGISTFNDNVVAGAGLTVTGISTFNSSVKFPNDAKALFGSVSGLEIYHAGSGNDSYIQKGTEGNLKIQADQLFLKTRTGSEYMMIANGNQQVELYYDGNKRFETTTDGVDISGTGSIKVPVGTTAQRNSSPTAGDFRYNSDEGAFEGYTDSWGSIGGAGGAEEVDTNVSSTSAVGVGSFATASFRSAEVIAQIVQIDEYQVGKYLMIHDGTTVTVIEQAAVATGDSMLGSFDGAINGSNAELRVNMVSSGIATVTTKISTVTI